MQPESHSPAATHSAPHTDHPARVAMPSPSQVLLLKLDFMQQIARGEYAVAEE